MQSLRYNHIWDAKILGLRIVRSTLGRLHSSLGHKQVVDKIVAMKRPDRPSVTLKATAGRHD